MFLEEYHICTRLSGSHIALHFNYKVTSNKSNRTLNKKKKNSKRKNIIQKKICVTEDRALQKYFMKMLYFACSFIFNYVFLFIILYIYCNILLVNITLIFLGMY